MAGIVPALDWEPVETNVEYGKMMLAAGLDIFSVSVLALAIYFPRHQRRDLMLAFVAVNAGLFTVTEFVADRNLNLAVGLGLFALLSVVRFRSSEIAQEDIGYYFVALVLGLINGFASNGEWERVVTLNALLLLIMFLADHPWLLRGRMQQVVTLDAVHADPRALIKDLEERLDVRVTKIVVLRTDFVHRHTVVDVRYRERPHKKKHHTHAAPERGGVDPGAAFAASTAGPVNPEGPGDGVQM